jgi:hypothetical protein
MVNIDKWNILYLANKLSERLVERRGDASKRAAKKKVTTVACAIEQNYFITHQAHASGGYRMAELSHHLRVQRNNSSSVE